MSVTKEKIDEDFHLIIHRLTLSRNRRSISLSSARSDETDSRVKSTRCASFCCSLLCTSMYLT